MYGRKTATLNLRIAPKVKEAAEQAADDDNRSLTSLVETLLLSHLREHGYLPRDAASAAKPSGGGSDQKAKTAPLKPDARKPAAPTRKAEPAAPRSKLDQIRALREQGAR
jgi:hypothetical protein